MRKVVLVLALFCLGLGAALLTGSNTRRALAADEVLLDTLTIDGTTNSSKTGTVTLKKGTLYHLNVSGTMTVIGPYRYDAVWCYGGRTGQPDCDPMQHQEASPQGSGLFAGTTSATLSTRIDSFQTPPPPCCTTGAPYASSHTYSVPYYPDVDGKLRLQTRNGTANCSTSVCPETTTGSFTVQIYGPPPSGGGGTTSGTTSGTTDTTGTTGATVPTTTDTGSTPLPEVKITAGSVIGEVAFRVNAGEWQELKPGQLIPQGAEIFTGIESGVNIQFPDGSSFQLRELSQLLLETVEIKANRKDVAVRLRVGELNAQVKKEKVVDTNFEIQTPTATTSVRGTVFTVFADAVAKAEVVSVKEGTVEVDPAGAGLKTVLVPAGKEVEVTAASISPLAAPGKGGARGGTNRVKARRLVLAKLHRAPARCKLTTPRSEKVVIVKPAPKGWLVSVRVAGKAKGKSSWSVKGTRVKPANGVAKKISRGCR